MHRYFTFRIGFQLGLIGLLFGLLNVSAVHAQLFPDLGGQRAGISALTFLKIDVSPRGAALGGAQVALPGDAYALQWNPAAITDLPGTSVGLAHNFWIAGINHSYFSAAHNFGNAGTVGLTATALTSGAIEKRTETQPNGTGENVYAYYVATGLSYARFLTDKFSFGVTVKYVNETLDSYVAHTAVVDVGFLYRVDWRDLNFAVMLQSFGPNSSLNGDALFSPDGQEIDLNSDPAPTVFSMGLGLMALDMEDHGIRTLVQLNHPNDNAENVRLGVEYDFREMFFARGGYKINVEDQPYPTFGAGIRARLGRHPLMIDYAVDPLPTLGWRQRVGLSLNLLPYEERGSEAERRAPRQKRKRLQEEQEDVFE